MIFKNDLKKIASQKRYYLFYTFVCGGEDGSHYVFKILKFIILLRYSHCYPLWIILSYNCSLSIFSCVFPLPLFSFTFHACNNSVSPHYNQYISLRQKSDSSQSRPERAVRITDIFQMDPQMLLFIECQNHCSL